MACILVSLARFYDHAELYTGNPVLQKWCLDNMNEVRLESGRWVDWIASMMKKSYLYINSQERMELMAS